MRLAHLRHYEQFHEPAWHVVLALSVVIGLQLTFNNTFAFGIKYLIIGLEILLLLTLGVVKLSVSVRRLAAISLIAIISVVNCISLALVIATLFGDAHIEGRQLLVSALAIYLTNIIVFGLWYWELDSTRKKVDDFQFPRATIQKAWRPTFFDYLYVSITNATAFSPTDTLPLTHRAKLLMTIQAVLSLVTVVLVAARAVNILS